MFETSDTSLLESEGDPEIDSVALERAAQRAALDLQRIVALLAQRYLGLRRAMPGRAVPAPTWRLLLDIEEQAFADLGFKGRHPVAVRDDFSRLADSRLAGPDLDAPVDWQRDDDPLPAVYAIVRGLVQELSTGTM
ncbi:DUF2471 domain-containing protein (plasmid) [Burkholderia thailandensis]|uniref:DUF2471 family protein n=1 Tax=Burkholderia thailandensis TaxID=57975 RepID=UPI00192D4D24|nr:DUF2471 family protein [Burkholderia thailandensis]MBS2132299.1 DUF2471 domain-containing protein [Burkholderia thailandensis]QRA15110.1 DUF2471 domain-containing protein [Burkholderia thailandensis]